MKLFQRKADVEKIATEDRVVLGEPHRARLFRAYVTDFVAGFPYGFTVERPLGTYLSCKDAFEQHPGCMVKEVDGIRVGGEYFTCGHLVPVKVTRPKRKAKEVA